MYTYIYMSLFNKNALGMLENVSHTVLLRACITCAQLLHLLEIFEIDTKF